MIVYYYIMAKAGLDGTYNFTSRNGFTMTETKENALCFLTSEEAYKCVAQLQEARPEWLFGILRIVENN